MASYEMGRYNTFVPGQLDAELSTFQQRRNDLLGAGEGKFVLIHGTDFSGIFDSEGDAIMQGYERFGNVPS